MPNYDTADRVADFLADFKIRANPTVTVTDDDNHSFHRFDITLSRGGAHINSLYDKPVSPDDGASVSDPTVPEVVSALISDASMADRYHIGDFLDTFSDTRMPSQAFRAYESCKAANDWLCGTLHLTRSELSEMNEVLKSEPDAVRVAYEKVAREQAEKETERHPPVPEGFISVEELQNNLDLGEFEDEISDASFDSCYLDDVINECADNSADVYTANLADWYAANPGLVEDAAEGKTLGHGCTIDDIIMEAQCDYARSDLNEHREDICIYGTLDVLQSEGLYAINRTLADDILNGDVDFEVDRVPTGDVKEAIFDNFYVHLQERYGDEVADVPFFYTYGHLRDALTKKHTFSSLVKHPHGLTAAQVKRLPELLSHPVVLMDSDYPDKMVAVLNAVDNEGQPLIAAIRPGGTAVMGNRAFPGNIVLSVYGKSETFFVKKMLEMPERIVYQDIEKGRELDARAKLQLFGGHIVAPDLVDKIIRPPECVVNLKLAGQRAHTKEWVPTRKAQGSYLVRGEAHNMKKSSARLGKATGKSPSPVKETTRDDSD